MQRHGRRRPDGNGRSFVFAHAQLALVAAANDVNGTRTGEDEGVVFTRGHRYDANPG